MKNAIIHSGCAREAILRRTFRAVIPRGNKARGKSGSPESDAEDEGGMGNGK